MMHFGFCFAGHFFFALVGGGWLGLAGWGWLPGALVPNMPSPLPTPSTVDKKNNKRTEGKVTGGFHATRR